MCARFRVLHRSGGDGAEEGAVKVGVIDLFCGISAPNQAANRAFGGGNVEILMAVDWEDESDGKGKVKKGANKAVFDTYESNYGVRPMNDITSPEVLAEAKKHRGRGNVLLTAGFPCQPFSNGGEKLGTHDARFGSTMTALVAIAKAAQPDVIILENSSKVGEKVEIEFGPVKSQVEVPFRRMGYNIACEVINAGFFSGTSRVRMFWVMTKMTSVDLSPVTVRQGNAENLLSMEPYLLPKTEAEGLKTNLKYELSHLGRAAHGVVTDKKTGHPKAVNPKVLGLGTKRCGKLMVESKKKTTDDVSQPNRIFRSDGLARSFCKVNQGSRSNGSPEHIADVRFDPPIVRPLTLREMYNIMGFDADFVICRIDKEAYKHIGNSIAVPVLTAIFKQLVEQGFLTTRGAEAAAAPEEAPAEAAAVAVVVVGGGALVVEEEEEEEEGAAAFTSCVCPPTPDALNDWLTLRVFRS